MSDAQRAEERIIVLAPSASDALVTAALLSKAGLEVVVVRDGTGACRAIEEGAAAVLIAEEALSPATAQALAELLARQEPWSDLPIVLFTGRGARPGSPPTLDALAPLGNVTLLERPLEVITVVSAARAAVRARRRQYAARAALYTAQRRAEEIERMQGEARRTADALREVDRQKTAFLAVLSHELRNPLAPIRNSVTVLEKAPPGSETAHRALEVLRRQTDQLGRLVDDLLDVNRISHGKIEMHLERLDACEVVRRTCADARALFDSREVELTFHAPAGPVWVDADAARLSQIIGNLLSNALKFTPRHGAVRVGIAAQGASCEVSVRDTGQGLGPAELDHVFDPFWQAERTRHGHGGLGLGLALVRELVAKHGGAVRAESAGPGEGATFFVQLPLASAPRSTTGARSASPTSSGLDVLIIEDNEDAATTLADLLVLAGHRATTVATGRAGVSAAETERPDVVICDVGLPDISGHEVIRAIRARADGRRIFAIALTGYAQPEDRDAALAAGFDAHLRKPPALEALEALLVEAARRRGSDTMFGDGPELSADAP